MNFIIDWLKSVWEQQGGPFPALEEPVADSHRDRSSMAELVRILQAQDVQDAEDAAGDRYPRNTCAG
jgi:hypothetical protein